MHTIHHIAIICSDKACCLNAEHAVDRLKKEFKDHPEIGDAVIEGAVCDIRTGEVRWLGTEGLEERS